MAEYHHTLSAAMLFPLEAYLALIPALVARRGGQGNGPDYVDQASISAREACWRFLRRHFTILPQGQPGPNDAMGKWLTQSHKGTKTQTETDPEPLP